MDVLKRFGKFVRDNRKARKLSQEEFAEMCDLSPRHITDIENGKVNPKLDTVIQICDALDVDATALFDNE